MVALAVAPWVSREDNVEHNDVHHDRQEDSHAEQLRPFPQQQPCSNDFSKPDE